MLKRTIFLQQNKYHTLTAKKIIKNHTFATYSDENKNQKYIISYVSDYILTKKQNVQKYIKNFFRFYSFLNKFLEN